MNVKSWRFVVPTIALLIGMMLPSATFAAGVPAPASPTNVMAWAGNQSIRVTWQSPVIAMIYQLSHYQINVYQDGQLVRVTQFAAPATEETLGSLANGRTYMVTIQVSQSTVGPGAQESTRSVPSAPSNPVVPPGGNLAAPPTGIETHATDAAALVTWIAPTGPTLATMYQLTVYQPGSGGWSPIQWIRTASGTPTAAWVTGLDNGQSYRFTVRTANASGWSAESALTNPTIAPTSISLRGPTITSATAGNGSATLSWSGLSIAGVSHYVVLVTRLDGTLVTYQDHAISPLTIAGLTNGVSYIVQVRAVTPQYLLTLPASVQVVPQAAVLPPAPTNLRATPGDRAVTLAWDNPVGPAQGLIDHYTVSVFAGAVQVWSNPNVVGTSVVVPGLVVGQGYTAQVRSVSAADASSNPVSVTFTGATYPGAPFNVQAVLSNGSVIVTWTAPTTNGSSPITGYLVRGSSGLANESISTTVDAAHNSATFANLVSGRSYTFTVQTLNVIGGSLTTGVSNPVTVATAPGQPTGLTVTAGDGSITVQWSAPMSNGGSTITGYQVSVSDGLHVPSVMTVTGTSAVVSGLTNGVTYTVSVAARNNIGLGSPATAQARPVNLPPVLTVPGNQVVQYGRILPLQVTATGPEPADHLTFSAVGLPAGLTLVDNGNGSASIAGSVMAAPGTYTVTVVVNDGHNPVVSQAFGITVTREDALITPQNPTALVVKKASDTKTVHVAARIRESALSSGNLANVSPVTIVLHPMGGGVGIRRTASLSINSKSVIAMATFGKLPVNVYRISVSVGGTYYQGQAISIMTIASQATSGSVAGSGDVESLRAPGAFNMQARIHSDGTVSGSLTYSGHHPEGYFVIKGHLVGGLIVRNHRAFFQARGTMNGVDGYRFAVAAVDTRQQEHDGLLAIWTIDPQHQLVGHCTFTLTPVTGGQIVVSGR